MMREEIETHIQRGKSHRKGKIELTPLLEEILMIPQKFPQRKMRGSFELYSRVVAPCSQIPMIESRTERKVNNLYIMRLMDRICVAVQRPDASSSTVFFVGGGGVEIRDPFIRR